MAGYSKGIVATRKLNDNNKAKLGRGGDTKIREVDNKKSHVNALEAYLIDVNGKAGEDYAKRVGAGTINPLTGMPEYHAPGLRSSGSGNDVHTVYKSAHDDTTHSHPGQNVAEGSRQESTHDWSEGSQTYTPEQKINWDAQNSDLFEGGNMPDYDVLSTQDEAGLATTLTAFDEDLGIKDVAYFQDIFTDEPFDFLEQQQDLTTRGLESAYGATMGALGSREKTLGLQREGLTAQQTALGRTTGRGLREAGKGRDIAISRSGLATSGTITQGYETQKKDLFQDYTAGTKDIQRQKGTALEILTLGKEEAGLDLRAAEYAEKKKQLDQMCADVGATKL